MLISEQLLQDQKQVETSLIAMVYQYPTYAVKVLQWLDPSMLVNRRYSIFWRGVKEKVTPNLNDYDAGKMVTQAWLDAELNMNGDFHQVVNMPDLDIESLGDEIRKIQYMLASERQASEVAKAIQTRDIAKIRTAIEGFDIYRNTESATMGTADAVSDEFIAAIDADNLAISSGIPGIDRAIGGFAIRDATVVAARPSMGKTALGLQCARNAAHQGKKAGFFSLEMSGVALWARMACPAAGCEWKDVISKNITVTKRDKLKAESRRLAEQYRDTLLIDDNSHQTVDTIWEKVIKNDLDIIFVDHLSLLKDRPDMPEHLRLGHISMGLKSLAKSLGVASVYLAQLNRGTEHRAERRPTLSDLRDSGKIEENADTVLMIYREEYYSDGGDKGGITEVWVRKFRNGLRNSKIELEFDINKEWFDSPKNKAAAWTAQKGM